MHIFEEKLKVSAIKISRSHPTERSIGGVTAGEIMMEDIGERDGRVDKEGGKENLFFSEGRST